LAIARTLLRRPGYRRAAAFHEPIMRPWGARVLT